MWLTRAHWSGSSARRPLSDSLDGFTRSIAPHSAMFLSGVLPPAPSRHFCSLSDSCEVWNSLLPLMAARAHSFQPNPLRTGGSPAAQFRPENCPQTHTTQDLVSLAPMSGPARRSNPADLCPWLSTRCESPVCKGLDFRALCCYNGPTANRATPASAWQAHHHSHHRTIGTL